MSELPEHVGSLLRAGLETGQKADRLVALEAANQADQTDEALAAETRYGLTVMETLLEQAGIELDPSEDAAKIEGYSHTTAEEARLTRAVSQAIGQRIGITFKFHEYLAHPEQGGSLVVVDGEQVGHIPDRMKPTAPYYLTYKLHKEMAWGNFSRAKQAVRGLVGRNIQLDQGWTSTLARIQGLKEVTRKEG